MLEDPVQHPGIQRRMTERDWHHIWVKKCEAAEAIKLRYGLKSAFDYVVAEKLLNFAEAAARHPEFASDLAAVEDGGLDFQDPAAVAERARQFDLIKDLLTVTQLGTS